MSISLEEIMNVVAKEMYEMEIFRKCSQYFKEVWESMEMLEEPR